MNIMAGSCGGIIPSVNTRRLQVVSVVVNNLCNLRCRHCYLEPEDISHQLLPAEWGSFFTSLFRDAVPDILTFAGKEVFADRVSSAVLFDAINQRNRIQGQHTRRTRIGVITNGTLLKPYRQQLIDNTPDWIDVSVDGTPQINDSVRGENAFQRLEPNLRWLASEMLERIWITHTLMEHNSSHLNHLVETMNRDYGINQFSLGVYRCLSYTDAALSFGKDRAEQVASAIIGLSNANIKSSVCVHVECDSDDPLLAALHRYGFLLEGWPLSETTHSFENGLTLVIRAMRAPVGLWRSVRVTNDGLWLAAEDLVDAKRYKELAVGSLRNKSFDAVQLHAEGIRHPRFQQVVGMPAADFLRQIELAQGGGAL